MVSKSLVTTTTTITPKIKPSGFYYSPTGNICFVERHTKHVLVYFRDDPTRTPLQLTTTLLDSSDLYTPLKSVIQEKNPRLETNFYVNDKLNSIFMYPLEAYFFMKAKEDAVQSYVTKLAREEKTNKSFTLKLSIFSIGTVVNETITITKDGEIKRVSNSLGKEYKEKTNT